MATALKPGTRLRSVTCTTEVVVVRGAGDIDVRCGGQLMVDPSEAPASTVAVVPPFDQGTAIGKRYADEEAGVELLCTKAGEGSLSLGDVPLELKGAKPLPASD